MDAICRTIGHTATHRPPQAGTPQAGTLPPDATPASKKNRLTPPAAELPNVEALEGGALPPMQDTTPLQDPRFGPAKPAPGRQARSRPRSGPSRRAAGKRPPSTHPPPMRRPKATKLAKEAPPSLTAPPGRGAEETDATGCDRPARPP
nr:uncharacterized protein LOC127304290 [Lolium perenne]